VSLKLSACVWSCLCSTGMASPPSTSTEILESLNKPENVDVFDVTWRGGLCLLDSGFQPSVVVIMGGTNDLGDTPAPAIVDSLRQTHQAFHRKGFVTIAAAVRVVSGLVPRFMHGRGLSSGSRLGSLDGLLACVSPGAPKSRVRLHGQDQEGGN
jgi:hypothetical protein